MLPPLYMEWRVWSDRYGVPNATDRDDAVAGTVASGLPTKASEPLLHLRKGYTLAGAASGITPKAGATDQHERRALLGEPDVSVAD